MGFLKNHFQGWKFHGLLESSFHEEYSMFFWKTINHMGFWKFIFQKEIPMFSEMHFSKNGKSHEFLKNYFVLKIMGFIGFLWKTNSLFRSTFGKNNIYIYIYIYIINGNGWYDQYENIIFQTSMTNTKILKCKGSK